MRIALVGCGAVGKSIAGGIDRGLVEGIELSWVYDKRPERARELCARLSRPPKVASNLDEILDDESVQLVIEAASHEAVRQYASRVLSSGKNLMVLSVGALLDQELLQELLSISGRTGARLIVPSGAVGGIDALKALSASEVQEVELTSTKNPKSLGLSVEERQLVFEGDARLAVRKFPRSLNIAATLALVAGPDKVRVKLFADPDIETTVHELKIVSKAGEFYARIKSPPSKDNPKTSMVTPFSVLCLLRELFQNFKVGT